MPSETPLPQGKATIVFTDIEDSSRMTRDLGNDIYKHQVRDPHSRVLLAEFEQYRGVPIQTQGDSFMAVFQRADDALACVSSIQNRFDKEPIALSSTSGTWKLKVRIGVHTTEQEIFPCRLSYLPPDAAMIAGNVEYPGGDTNFAARIGGLGIGGQVIVADSTYRAAARRAQYDWQEWPNRRLKSFDEAPEVVWELLYDGQQTRGEPGTRWVPKWYEGELNRYIARPELQERVISYFKEKRGGVRKRLVTLQGEGGMGKSRLALACALEMAGLFQDGVYFVNLSREEASQDLRSRDAFADAICRELTRSGMQVQPTSLLASFRTTECLLVLDNYESAECEEVRRFLRDLIAQARSLCLLVTGRTAVMLPDAERVVFMNDGMNSEQARNLFLSCAGLGAPDVASYDVASHTDGSLKQAEQAWMLSSEEEADIQRILRLTEGIPLAVELAAAWLQYRYYTVKEIADGLEATPLGEMSSSHEKAARVDPSRHHYSLKRSLDWSYNLLAAEEQPFFAAMSLFAADFTREAAAIVTGVEDSRARRLLNTLYETSLLRRNNVLGVSRDSFHRFTRAYAQEKLAESCSGSERSEMQQRQAEYFLDLAQEALPFLKAPDPQKKVARLEAEVPNVSAALEWCVENNVPLGLRVATGLWHFWWMRGQARAGRERILSLLSKADRSLATWAEAALVAGHLSRHIGDFARATKLFAQSLEVFNERNDPSGAARALRHQGVLAWHQGRGQDARSLLDEALAKSRGSGKPEDAAECYYELGNLARHQGRHEEAEPLLKESLAFFREASDTRWTATALLALGNVTLRLHKADEARSCYAESLKLFDEIKDQGRLALAFERIAAYARLEDRLPQAAILIGASQRLRQEIGAPLPLPDGQEYYDELIADLERELGPDYVLYREEGRSMALPDAVKIAGEEVN